MFQFYSAVFRTTHKETENKVMINWLNILPYELIVVDLRYKIKRRKDYEYYNY